MTIVETTELIKACGELLTGLGLVGTLVMGVINHRVIKEVRAQTNGLVEQGRMDARAAGRQEQKDERAASDEGDRVRRG
jgi:hypothetical protein